MNPPKSLLNHAVFRTVAMAFGAGLAGPSIFAASLTWDGGGTSGGWSSGGNWVGNVPPVAEDSLVFERNANLAANNDFVAATRFSGITFGTSAGVFVLSGNAVTLDGAITSQSTNVQAGIGSNSQVINTPFILASAPTIHVSRKNGSVTLGGAVSGPFGINKTGAGNAVLAVSNSFSGPINISGGTLSFEGGGDRLGHVNNSITLNGGTLRTTTGSTLVSTHAITVGNGGGGAGTVDLQNNVSYSGVIAGASGTSGLVKTGWGQLTLAATNTYTGQTSITQGTLATDFNSGAAGVVSIIQGGSSLVMGGYGSTLNTVSQSTLSPTLYVQAKTNTANAQAFNGLNLNQGNSTIVSRSLGTGGMTLNLGGITRNAGGLVNFNRLENAAADTDPVIATTASNTNGILGGWATIAPVTPSGTVQGGTDWAAVSGNNIVGYSAYVVPTGAAPVLANAPSANIRLDAGSTGNISFTYVSNICQVNTIQMTDPLARLIDIASGKVLRLGSFGGVWKNQANANPLTIGTTANTGTLTAGGSTDAAGEIVFNGNATGSSTYAVVANSVIANNGAGIVSIAKTGVGSLELAAVNTYTGNTFINAGRVVAVNSRSFGGDGTATGSGTVLIQPGGQAFLSGAAIYANHFVIAGNGTTENGSYGAIRVFNAATTVGTSSSTITLAGDARIGGSGSTGVATIAAKITGDFNLELAAAGGGSNVDQNVFLLTNTANDFGGNVGINATAMGGGQGAGHIGSSTVQLRVGASGVVPNGNGKGNVVIGGGGNPANLGTFDLNGFNETINGLQSVTNGGSEENTRVTNNAAGGATLILGDGDATASFAGKIVNGPAAAVALTKIGSGTQVLSGGNTYTGATNVNGGTLALTGGLGATAVAVNNTGTLSGNGVIGGSVTVNNGGRLACAVAATPAAQVPLSISGSLTLAAGCVIDVTAFSAPAVGSYILATAAGGISYTPGTTNFTGTGGVLSVSGNNLVLTVAVGYSSWASANGIGGQPASGDFDNDGLSNLVEYALGTSPGVPTKAAGSFSAGTVTFVKGSEAIANGDVAYVIEKSADLGKTDPWIAVVSHNPPNGATSVSYALPVGQARQFVRLRVTRVP